MIDLKTMLKTLVFCVCCLVGTQAASGSGVPAGACCFGGACQILAELDCQAAGGEYQGDDTTCEPGTCPAPNDLCQDAETIACGDTVAFSNIGATDDGPSPCGLMGSDIWYCFEAEAGQTVSTCGSGYDTVLAAYGPFADCADAVANCVPIIPGDLAVCNDDSCGLQSEISFGNGGAYLIQVGGFNGAQGSGQLLVSVENCAQPVEIDIKIDIKPGSCPNPLNVKS
jgi:hypothetical protein